METNGKIEVTKKSKYISIGVFLPAGPKGEKLAKVQCENGKCTHVCEDLSPAYSKEYDEAGIFLEEEALVRDGDLLYFIDCNGKKTRDVSQRGKSRKCKKQKEIKLKVWQKIVKIAKEIFPR